MSNPGGRVEEGRKATAFIITGIDDLNKKAVRRAGNSTVSMIKREIRKKYNIRLSDMNSVIETKAGDYAYQIKISTKALPAIIFKPVEIRNNNSIYRVSNKKTGKGGTSMSLIKAKLQKRFKGSATGVRIEFEKGQQETVEPGGRGIKGFIVKTPGRGLQIYYRRDEKRDRIFKFYKGSVAGLASSTVSMDNIREYFTSQYVSELQRLSKHLGTSQQ